MCFAHLMSEEQIQTVLKNSLTEADKYLEMFAELEGSSMADWPPGMQFVCKFGEAMVAAKKAFIENHRQMLCARDTQDTSSAENLAAG
jgi:hypothetical protein